MRIPLTKGAFAIVDSRDWKKYKKYKWYLQGRAGESYAARRTGGKIVLLHRLITGAKEGQYVDHRNGNRLDNRRSNLRTCNGSQNACNKGKMPRRGRPDAPTGICYTPELNRKNPWLAQISVKYKQYYLGYFPTIELAAEARRKAELKYHGKFSTILSRNSCPKR